MNFMLFFALLAQWKTIEIKEPFPTPEQIWAVGATLLGLWIFAVGASVGSFINVVVYRLPAGLSLSSPGSRCPRCLHPIRLQHNLPIIGWLMLRGRCADCQLPISARYPLVELLVGTLFLLVGGVELLGNGINLPRPSPELARTVLSTNEPQPLIAATLVHLVLLSTLVSAALIDRDGQPIPKRIALPAIGLAAVVALLWPAVHPVAALELSFSKLPPEVSRPLQSPLLDIILGGFAGVLATAFVRVAIGSRRWLKQRYGGVLTLLWIATGMVLGWQMMPLILAGWAALQIGASPRDLLKQPLRPIRDLTLVVLIAILAWRLLAGYSSILSASTLGQTLVYVVTLSIATILLVSAALQLPAEYEFPQPVPDEAFLPTPPSAPIPAVPDSTTVDDSSLSSNESSEYE